MNHAYANEACLISLSSNSQVWISVLCVLSFSHCLSVNLIFCLILLVLLHFLLSRCPAFRRLREEAEKRKRPSWNETKGSKAEEESDSKSNPASTRPANPRGPPEPGMVNPAFEEADDGKAFLLFFSNRNSNMCNRSFTY